VRHSLHQERHILHQEHHRDHQPYHNQHEVDNLEANLPSVNLILQTSDPLVVLQENTPNLGLKINTNPSNITNLILFKKKKKKKKRNA
jgi:hypothetical protein